MSMTWDLTDKEIAKILSQHVVNTLGLGGSYEVKVVLRGVKKDGEDDRFSASVTIVKEGE